MKTREYEKRESRKDMVSQILSSSKNSRQMEFSESSVRNLILDAIELFFLPDDELIEEFIQSNDYGYYGDNQQKTTYLGIDGRHFKFSIRSVTRW